MDLRLRVHEKISGLGRTERLVAICSILLVFLIVPFISGSEAYVFSIVGGCLGSVSSIIVILGVTYSPSNQQNASSALLYWRAICDLGLGLRFLCYYLQNLYVCNSAQCYITYPDGSRTDYQNRCNLPSAILEFFEIASEGWFICLAIDLAVTISNPFSSFNDRYDNTTHINVVHIL